MGELDVFVTCARPFWHGRELPWGVIADHARGAAHGASAVSDPRRRAERQGIADRSSSGSRHDVGPELREVNQ